MSKFEPGETVYSCFGGILRVYTVTTKAKHTPAKGCDMLILCDRGGVHSAKSESYHATREAALDSAIDTCVQRRKIYQKRINSVNAEIAKIQALRG